MARVVPAYRGPQCPRCDAVLPSDAISSGTITCPSCGVPFEATAFQPPVRPERRAMAIAGAGPDGGNACATHPLNAATTSCQRCGLFICTLCEMSISAGTFCPNCFDRIREEGTVPEVATRYKDYASLARLSMIAGIVMWFCAPIGGGLAVYYATKGLKQRRDEGRSRAGVVIVMILAVLEVILSLAFYVAMGWGMFAAAKATP
jgi:hypothetical protein